jgi:hypothetical protein
MTSAKPLCYVVVTASGVLNWMTQAHAAPERLVLEQLLEGDTSQAIDMRALSLRLQWPLKDLARVVFALNRSQDVQVSVTPPASAGRATLAALSEPLHQLTQHSGPALIASSDGLCIAVMGWTRAQADQLAAQLSLPVASKVVQTTLRFAHQAVTLMASREPDRNHPAWVELARCLLPTCGKLSDVFGKAA